MPAGTILMDLVHRPRLSAQWVGSVVVTMDSEEKGRASDSVLRVLAVVCLVGSIGGGVMLLSLIPSAIAGLSRGDVFRPVWSLLMLAAFAITLRSLIIRWRSSGPVKASLYAWIYCFVLNAFWISKALSTTGIMKGIVLAGATVSVVLAGIGFALERRRVP